MPYENEFATTTSLKRLTENKRVKEILDQYEIVRPDEKPGSGANLSDCTIITNSNLPRRSNWLPEYIISIDGSPKEVDVDNGFPSSKVGYLSVASVLLKLQELQELDKVRPVDPQKLKKTHETDPVDSVLPGCNVVYKGEFDARSSLRRGVLNLFGDQKAFNSGETVLETYEYLLKDKPSASQKCPYGDDCGSSNPSLAYERGVKTYECSCSLKLPFHSTDALRFHERFNPVGENAAIYTEIMQVIENLWLINILRGLETRGYLYSLSKIAIIMDGALAIYGQPAWLSQAIYKELLRLNNKLKEETESDLLIIGVEKTGIFVNHFDKICQSYDKEMAKPKTETYVEDKTKPKLEPQTAVLLTDKYIRRKVQFSEGKHQYGAQTYFGRKFFYRAKSGAKLVLTVPYLDESHRDWETANVDQFPRLADALNVLDATVSSRYPNALMPISLAHSEVAIPLRQGAKILEVLTREIIGGTKS